MADNVQYQSGTLATPPSATTVATDEVQVSGTQPLAHVQYMKLVDGTPNGTGAISGDSANGLDVDVTRLPAIPAGNNNIGDVDISPAGTATRSSVNDNNIDTQLLVANANRKMAVIVNDSDQDLYVGLGSGAVSTVDYSYFLPKSSGGQKSQLELPLPVFTGEIRGIWAANSTGAARITELT